jgi:CHAT domain-containing protein
MGIFKRFFGKKSDQEELQSILQELSQPGRSGGDIPHRIQLCRQAIAFVPRERNPELWAALQNELGNNLAQNPIRDRAENIERAIEHYNEALRIFNPDSYPNYCRSTAKSLGNLRFQKHRWKEAIERFKLAKTAAERLYQASMFLSSREAELAETGDLYRRASYSLAKTGENKEAVISLEQGRARGLSEALARDRADLERVRVTDPETYNLYRKAAKRIRSLETLERSGGLVPAEGKTGISSESLREQALTAYAEMSKATDRIRCIQGYENFLKEPNWDDIAAAVTDDQPLVYLVTTPDGSLALIAAKERSKAQEVVVKPVVVVEPVWLEGFIETKLREMLTGPPEDEGLGGWFGAYTRWLDAWQKIQDEKADDKAIEEMLEAKARWLETIVKVTADLWQGVLGPVVDRLCDLGFTQAFLVPSGYLALLPLHAASWEENGDRHYALEKIAFAYAPSARSLVQARRIAESSKAQDLLAIDEPKPVEASSLPNSQAEVNAIAAFFEKPQILRHENAERGAVLRALPKAQVAHFSCHGGVNWEDPDKSGLLMAHGKMLTVQDLFQLNLKGARMAMLSACETGVVGTKLPDEVVALPSAFMRAGFAGVVASLWTVSDLSTAMLMKFFYKCWQEEGFVPVRALREAQKRLRETEGFEHPLYWAAFYLTGV